jgi:hypothetical protein
MANKSGIHINLKNKGKFNALKKRTGKTTEQLTHSKNPLTRKRAQFALNAKKWKHPYGGLIYPYALGGSVEDYSLGGDIFSGATTGMAFGPWGALAGGAVGLVKGLIGNAKEKKQEELEDMQRRSTARDYASQAQAGIVNNYLPTFAFGGPISAEIEKEEVVVPPNGIQAGVRRKFNLPTHKNKTGENLISAEPGSFVISDKLMYDENRTMAQAYEEAGKKVDRYQKVLDSPKSTTLAIKTSKRNLDNIKKLQQQIIEKNKLMLAEKQGQFNSAGIPQATFGSLIGGIGKFLKSDAGTGLLSLAPVASNLISGLGKPDQLNAQDYYNPMANQALSEMSNRRFNTGPGLAANANAAAAAMGNVVNQGGSRGMVNANRQALLSARMMADNSVNAQAQNMNNQYLGEQAQFRAGIGQQMANTKLGIKDINDRNAAAKRGMISTAMGQLGQFGQTQQLMRNQKDRDTDMMTRWQGYLDMMTSGKKPDQSLNPIAPNESYLEQRGWQ